MPCKSILSDAERAVAARRLRVCLWLALSGVSGGVGVAFGCLCRVEGEAASQRVSRLRVTLRGRAARTV
jgi:hypothetical protein